jgi:predicted ABC-type ATPase
MSKLILLGGPAGAGKSTEMRHLATLLPRAALVDADDVWRISKELAQGKRDVVLANVIAVMRGYFAEGCELGVVSWVFARPALFELVIAGLQDVVDAVERTYLVASQAGKSTVA